MFDSSVMREEPAEFSLQRRDRGLDRRHPADVGRRQVPVLDPRGARVQGPPGKPQGMLVFDIELLEIKARRSRRSAIAAAAASPAAAAPHHP